MNAARGAPLLSMRSTSFYWGRCVRRVLVPRAAASKPRLTFFSKRHGAGVLGLLMEYSIAVFSRADKRRFPAMRADGGSIGRRWNSNCASSRMRSQLLRAAKRSTSSVCIAARRYFEFGAGGGLFNWKRKSACVLSPRRAKLVAPGMLVSAKSTTCERAVPQVIGDSARSAGAICKALSKRNARRARLARG